MSEQKIYQTITNVMSRISAVGKDRKNQQQNFMYRGVDDVMNELHPILAECRLFIVPEVVSDERTERPSKSGGVLFCSRQTIKFTFYADDGSFVSAVVIGEGMDSGDKASNKALSIAYKYACLQVFCIPTEDEKDPDATSPDPTAGRKPTPPPAQRESPQMKGGPSTPEEKREISNLLDSTYESGMPVFTQAEKMAYSKLRSAKTAGEVIDIVKSELQRRIESQAPQANEEDLY